ncbi:P-loop NTPase fold protein [Frigoribacterium sp. ACAM 257]|uniref:KAP family P-loop NTPase fold protein n=1 Tax=Frigoribacterium sp. ACAM 257 TaxID=2508998 RepID=UPI00174DFE0B|nr:P-loop NTPase fold protein [Frigoribacterium sp. ACAM 257]
MSANITSTRVAYPLFLDEPTDVDLLSFDAVASTVVDALLDPRLDPIALGLSGSWGSGKTSVLRLIGKQLHESAQTLVVIETDPWRYDPQLGIKESLISAILTSLENAIPDDSIGEKTRSAIQRLARRIDWAKALRLAATSAVTVSVPSLQNVFDLIKPREEESAPDPITDMAQFREEFASLLTSDAMNHISNVVVLVDDLDRCLPETVVDVLETIRLFLSVPKMSFVLAADEERVAEAIATRYPNGGAATGEESPARLYLHKIVQTSVPVPALSDFDAEAYLVLLQIRSIVGDDEQYAAIISDVAAARRGGQPLDQVSALQDARFQDYRNVAARIRPIVHEKSKGNPRRIKRFLNDLSVRLSIAAKRGITLDAATIAKLMVLEQYFPADFATVTGWLREQNLRKNLTALESQVGTPVSTIEDEAPTASEESLRSGGETIKTDGASKTIPEHQAPARPPQTDDQRFSEGLLRWARLSPALSGKELAPYLVLAASFTDVFLASEGLPESIRDVAAQLLSRSPAQARKVSNTVLAALTRDETNQLIAHIAGVMIDEPAQHQSSGLGAMLRLARLRTDAIPPVVNGLKRMRATDLRVGPLAQLLASDPAPIMEQLTGMADASGNSAVVGAMQAAKEDS